MHSQSIVSLTEKDIARFRAKYQEAADQCWVWTAGLSGNGYGAFRVGNKIIAAHRIAYMLSRGPIPNDLVVDHICHNRQCVNPNHLQLLTNGENARRQTTSATCANGHPRIKANRYYSVYLTKTGEIRMDVACKQCKVERLLAKQLRAGK